MQIRLHCKDHIGLANNCTLLKLNVCKKETNKQKKLPKMLTLNTVISSVVFKPAEHFQVSTASVSLLTYSYLEQ